MSHRSGYFRNEALSDRLGDLEIPDSEVENYIEALQAGRSIVAYFARPENLAKVEEIFSDSEIARPAPFPRRDVCESVFHGCPFSEGGTP